MLQPTVILNVRIPLDLATKLEALVKEGANQWPRVSKQGLVITLLNLGTAALASKVLAQATPKLPLKASQATPKKRIAARRRVK